MGEVRDHGLHGGEVVPLVRLTALAKAGSGLGLMLSEKGHGVLYEAAQGRPRGSPPVVKRTVPGGRDAGTLRREGQSKAEVHRTGPRRVRGEGTRKGPRGWLGGFDGWSAPWP
ncbi:hypothetical protein AwMethylo_40920 [Methylobacterium sp.]|nr:hypothetical protein AwMethylo_40920 [Methylobacterium sp.]